MNIFSKFKKLNNKGIVFDILTLFYTIIVVVVTMIIAGSVLVSFMSAFHEADMADEFEVQTNESFAQVEAGFRTFDALFFPIGIVGLIIGLIITSFMIPSHPIFIVVNIIGLIFLVLMSLVIQVVYENIIAVGDVAGGAGYLTFMPYVMEFLPWIGVVAVLIATIIGYSKRSEGAY